MSRIGKSPIELPAGITVKFDAGVVTVSSKDGSFSRELPSFMTLSQEETLVSLSVTDENDSHQKAQWGLNRTLIANMVEGLQNGYKKSLELQGVGYKFDIANGAITLAVGYSHKVVVPIPEWISVEADKDNKNVMHITGRDKQQVGEFSAKVRQVKKPEPYKGKGIHYLGEHIRRKAGKAGAK